MDCLMVGLSGGEKSFGALGYEILEFRVKLQDQKLGSFSVYRFVAKLNTACGTPSSQASRLRVVTPTQREIHAKSGKLWGGCQA